MRPHPPRTRVCLVCVSPFCRAFLETWVWAVCDVRWGPLLVQVGQGHVGPAHSSGPLPQGPAQDLPPALLGSAGVLPHTLYWELASSRTGTCPFCPGGSSQHFSPEAHLSPPTGEYLSVSDCAGYRLKGSPPHLAISFCLLQHTHIIQETRELPKTTWVVLNDHRSLRWDNLRIKKKNEYNWLKCVKQAFKKSIHSLWCIVLKALTGQIWRLLRH